MTADRLLMGCREYLAPSRSAKIMITKWQFRHHFPGLSVVDWGSSLASREVGMANFLRSATIVLMGATVMAAGVVVVLYS